MERHYQILGGASYIGAGGDGRDWQKAGGENDLPPRPPGRFLTVAQYEVFWLYPNLFFQPVGNFCFLIIHFPKAAKLTHQRLEFFFYGEDAMQEKYASERRRQSEFILQVNSEDIGICERAQAGRASSGFTGGVFCLQQEKTSLRAQQIIALHMMSATGGPPVESNELSFEDIRHSAEAAGTQP
jgi:phenylpropionate dioxygenase-like ring-hydroxylating dioxygenase large terminal subunit